MIIPLILGTLFSYLAWLLLNSFYKAMEKKKRWPRSTINEEVPESYPILYDIIERLFITILVAADISGLAGGIIAVIGIKMVAGWNMLFKTKENIGEMNIIERKEYAKHSVSAFNY